MFVRKCAAPVLTAGTIIALCSAAPVYAQTISGRVVGPDNKPFPGASIVVERFTGDGLDEHPPVFSGSDGTFILTLDREQNPASVAPNMLVARVTAAAKGFAPVSVTMISGKPLDVLQLRPAEASLHGTIKSQDGTPLAGVTVRVTVIYKGADLSGGYVSVIKGLDALYRATTDVRGGYTLENLPKEGSAFVMLDDPKYMRDTVRVPLTGPNSSTPLLTARPGGSITGQVLGPKGTPLPGVRVMAQGVRGRGNWAEPAITDANGTYRLSGLESATYNVMTNPPAGHSEVIAAAIENVAVLEGKEAAATPIRFTPGAVVNGRVLDADTGKPVAGIQIGSYGPHRPRTSGAITVAHTDAEGKFQMRVAPGDVYVYVADRTEYLAGDNSSFTGRVREGEATEQTFRLKKGNVLSGVVVNEAGEPVENVTVSVSEDYLPRSVSTDKQGQWSIKGLAPATNHIELSSEQWELIAPISVTIPSSAPVRLVVKHALPAHTLTGRVVDTNGQSLGEVAVTVERRQQVGSGAYTVRREPAVSNSSGTWTISGLKADEKLKASAHKEGYRFVRGGKVTEADGNLQVSNLVLVALTGKLSGTILNPGNKPVAGALVLIPEGQIGSGTATNAQGRFTLNRLPADKMTVFAGLRRGFAQGTFDADAKGVTLVLDPVTPQTKQDILRGYNVLEAIWNDSKTASYYARTNLPGELLPYAPELAEKLTGADNRTGRNVSPWQVQSIAEHNPELAVRWGLALLSSITDSTVRQFIMVSVGRSLIRLKRVPEARNLYTRLRSEAAQAMAAEGTTPPSDGALYAKVMIASLAGQLHVPEAEAMAREAAQTTQRVQGDRFEVHEAGFVLGEIASGDAGVARRVLDTLPEKMRGGALLRAAMSSAHVNPLGARELLAEADRLKTEKGDDLTRDAVAETVVEYLARVSPDESIAIARSITSSRYKPLALAFAATGQTDSNKRTEYFREAAKAASGGEDDRMETSARIAALAFNADPTLGVALFDAMKNSLLAPPKRETDEEENGRNIAAFAFYYARVCPGESRALIEDAWSRCAQSQEDNKKNREAFPLVLAMAAADMDRGLQMAETKEALGTRDPKGFDARRKIAQYLLATPEVKRTMPFDRWGASDTWTPGTPSDW